MCTVRIETLGCRLNQIESESLANLFIKNNFNVSMTPTTSSTEEDVTTKIAVLNTCTVTQKAEQKARRIIRLLLKKYPEAVIIVTGCYAQLAPDQIKAMDSRIAVIKGQVKSRLSELPQLLQQNINDDSLTLVSKINNSLNSVPQLKLNFAEDSFKLSASTFVAHSRASLKIQDGCNSNCSYCAIHMARGFSVSLDVETAIKRVQELEENGQSEVVLTTVNIGQYKGKYKDGYCNFTQLLQLLLENTKSISFRISSLYPEIVNDEFCKVIADKRVRPHFHISVQSGSDKILESMNRKYSAQTVIDACNKIKAYKNNPFLACDIITGFPGETDEDFELTMKLCRTCDFAWVHAFPYSERPGTDAAKMKNKVPQQISGERAELITKWAIQQKISYINNNKGKQFQAIIEKKKQPAVLINSTNNVYHAMTENFIHCEIVTTENLMLNKTVNVEITGALEERIKKGGDIEASAKIF